MGMVMTNNIQTRPYFGFVGLFGNLGINSGLLGVWNAKRADRMTKPQLWDKGGWKKRGATLELLLSRECPEKKVTIHLPSDFCWIYNLMKRTGDIYPYCAKTLLLNAEDEKCSGEKRFLQGALQVEGTVCAEEHICACVPRAMEREQESCLLHTLADKDFNCDRHDSD